MLAPMRTEHKHLATLPAKYRPIRADLSFQKSTLFLEFLVSFEHLGVLFFQKKRGDILLYCG